MLQKTVKLGKVGGLELSAQPTVLVAFLALWSLLALLGVKWLKQKPAQAAATGLIGALLHWLAEIWHHLGHARAASQTGYQMRGIRFWGPLATSVYPRDEGYVPADVHIQRALGGPIFSALLGVVAGLLALALRPLGGPAWYLVAFFAADNLLVFTLGALFPLRFTDGGTLLQWMGQRSGRISLQ